MKVVRFGELKAGDVIKGPHGPVRISEAYEEHMPTDMYEVSTDSGVTTEASGSHLWYVVTKLDKELHGSRLAEGKKLKSYLGPQGLEFLRELAHDDELEPVSLAHFIELCFAPESRELEAVQSASARIALSLGPVLEENVSYRDYESQELQEAITVPHYDLRELVRQLLSLMGDRKARKNWPVKVGRVVTTRTLASMEGPIHIPDPAT